MRERRSPVILLRALDQRLDAVATALTTTGVLADVSPRADDDAAPGERAGDLLADLVDAAADAPASDVAWLLLAGTFGGLPLADEVRAFRRLLETRTRAEAAAALLASVVARPGRGRLDLELDVATGTTVVNVDFCARHDIHTGIHRVVRETLPRWRAVHDLVATANIDEYSGLRTLAPREHARVFAYGGDLPTDVRDQELAYVQRLVVPWRSSLVIPEIPDPAFSPHLAAAAELSGNDVNVIGYDMIPVNSADLRPAVDAVRFGHYLSAIKHVTGVAGISVSATTEFRGFSHAVRAQGLPGPRVTEVLLPGDVPGAGADGGSARSARPRVLCVGSHEPHKNHGAVLHAAERLWQAGLDFELEFVGGTGWRSEEFLAEVARVRASGRPVRDRGRLSDEHLWEAYREAWFSVFLSVHEGFGLPVVESLACGTPVVTADYGSLAEIATDGGCLTVDPRDDDAILAALRTMLTDAATLARLTDEAGRRPHRTWDDYASELWAVLGAPTEAS